MKKVCIFGTCRVSALPAKCIKELNLMEGGMQSKLYETEDKIRIHTQPITYSSKLADVRDILKYMRGEIYQDKDPNTDKTFFDIFFRGITQRAFGGNKHVRLPREIVDGNDNDYDLYIFEIGSVREILFKTEKYGKEYYNKNLLWNIDIGIHNTIDFQREDFQIIDTKQNIESIFKEINQLCNNKNILIIGPYLINDKIVQQDADEQNIYIENISEQTKYINDYRIDVQNKLKLCIEKYDNIDYFDMTELIQQNDILKDQYHFNVEGQFMLSCYILNWINLKIYGKRTYNWMDQKIYR